MGVRFSLGVYKYKYGGYSVMVAQKSVELLVTVRICLVTLLMSDGVKVALKNLNLPVLVQVQVRQNYRSWVCVVRRDSLINYREWFKSINSYFMALFFRERRLSAKQLEKVRVL